MHQFENFQNFPDFVAPDKITLLSCAHERTSLDDPYVMMGHDVLLCKEDVGMISFVIAITFSD